MKLYVVLNKEGKFFKNKGYGGYGSNWKDNLDQAKFYPKIGQAKARVTYFAKHFPKFGVCDILEFTLDVNQAVVMNMESTTSKVIEKARIEAEQAEIRRNQYEIQRLQAERDALDLRIARRQFRATQ
jgi:hypothetical protein